MKDYNYDVALIMKKVIYDNGMVGFIPEKVVEGYYNDEEMCFIDFDGTYYYHIIDKPETYGFYGRESFSELKSSSSYLSSNMIKANKLKRAKKSIYIYMDGESMDYDIPIIGILNPDNAHIEQIFDGDIIKFYYYNYPDYFYGLYKDLVEEPNNNNEKLNESQNNGFMINNINIKQLFDEVTSQVIDQDEPIKKILIAIWKQYNDYSDNKSRNILINGSTGVGKTETFRVLTKLIDVPCVMTSATEYSATGYVGKSVNDMLVDLVKKADGDIEKAERGILIIDEIDKISESNSAHSQINQKDVQEALLKILEDGVFSITVNNVNYQFDTSKLLVVGMGSWSRIDLSPKTSIGFGSKTTKKSYKDITREDMVSNGLIPELVARFPIIVQMNELNFDSFVRILKSKNNSIAVNKKFFEKKGIDLIITDDAINVIAKIADKNNYGARGLDEIVERALSVASFEVASNPEKYSKLIITEDTIEDNTKYNLVEKEDIKKLTKKID